MSEPVEHMAIELTVNGEPLRVDIPVRLNLVDFLRHRLGLSGAHVGCEHGVCGACTVVVDGATVRGCLMLAVQADGCSVETVEGAAASGRLAALQDEFHARNALQCGFCTPGMLLTAAELLERETPPDRRAIAEHLSGNLCRCTGYLAIIEAVEAVAGRRR